MTSKNTRGYSEKKKEQDLFHRYSWKAWAKKRAPQHNTQHPAEEDQAFTATLKTALNTKEHYGGCRSAFKQIEKTEGPCLESQCSKPAQEVTSDLMSVLRPASIWENTKKLLSPSGLRQTLHLSSSIVYRRGTSGHRGRRQRQKDSETSWSELHYIHVHIYLYIFAAKCLKIGGA